MRRRGRVRRVGKWGGLVASCLLAALYATSTWFFIDRTAPRKQCSITIWQGFVYFYWGHIPGGDELPVWAMVRADEFGLGWWPRSWYRSTPYHAVSAPLWLPLLLVALPTAFLWYLDRRLPRGHCQACGYDLTGNVSGVCPECGEKV